MNSVNLGVQAGQSGSVVGGRRALTKSEICRARGWAKSYLSKPKFRDMPVFYRIEDFNHWYEARGQRAPKWTAGHSGSSQAAAGNESDPSVVHGGSSSGDTFFSVTSTPSSELNALVEKSRLAGQGLDFDERQAAQAEAAVDAAYALYLDAVETREAGRVAAALRNWSEASKQAQSVRRQYLELLEKSGALLDWEKAIRVVEQELLALRRRVVKQPDRLARVLNPMDPEQARRILIKDAEETLLMMEKAPQTIRDELEAEVSAVQLP